MEKKVNEWTKKDGVWERNGVFYPRVAVIKKDKLLKKSDIRNFFKPGTMVHYYENLMSKEEIDDSGFIYLASVRSVESSENACVPIPLGLLEFTPQQKKEIMKITGFPKSAFEKMPSGIHDEVIFDEPFGVDLGEPDDEFLGVGGNYGF